MIDEINEHVTLLTSAARTATPTINSGDAFINLRHKGIHLIIDVTAASATPSVVFTIQGYDRLSGKAYTILASAAITGTGTTVMRVYPGIVAAANVAANDFLPYEWKVTAVHADADSITYTLAAKLER